MSLIRSSNRVLLLLVALATAVLAAWTTASHAQPAEQLQGAKPAQLGKLGTVVFPTSCSPQAQTHFLRGVAALHSF